MLAVLIGGLSTVAGVVLLIGDQWLPADRYWIAALIIFLITGGLAARGSRDTGLRSCRRHSSRRTKR